MNQQYSRWCTILYLALLLFPVNGQQAPYEQYLDHPWVDSILATLSEEEQMAQTVWMTAGPDDDIALLTAVFRAIRQDGIGGLIIHPGSAEKTAQLINNYQSASKVPLAIAIEGEWGNGYPGPLALQAIKDDSLLYRMGKRMAGYYRLLGIELLLWPAVEMPVRNVLQENGILVTDRAGMGISDGQAPAGTHTADQSAGQAADQAAITRQARRILAFKYWSGLNKPVRADGIAAADLAGSPVQEALTRELYAGCLTVLNNNDRIIPLRGLESIRIATLAINPPLKNAVVATTPFQEMAGNYTRTDHFFWIPGTTWEDSLLKILETYDVVLAGIYSGGKSRGGSGPAEGADRFITALSGKTQLISVCFGKPDIIDKLNGARTSAGLVLTYGQNRWSEELAAQLLFGGIGGKGVLPVAIGNHYPAGSGISTPGRLRLQYGCPENAGVSSGILNHKIDSIVQKGLEAGAYPGCAVIAARNGIVIFHKTYGYHTYDSRIGVRKKDLYDLASVTKVSGPLPGLMMLESEGKFSHTGRLIDFVPSMKGSNKAALELKDILTHQAGLYPWIPFWENTVRKDGSYKQRFIRNEPSARFSVEVADRVYLKGNYWNRMQREIRQSALGEKKYVYSGLSFFLFPRMIERLSGVDYESFLTDSVYHRLGAWDLGFRPYRYYPLSRIVPTEYDSLFRKQLVHGYVHDEGAAMMGAYAGNAGLFSTANDLLKLFEMYRRMGSYGGEQLIAEEVLRTYSAYQFPELGNRRGLGFDKPLLDERDGTEKDYPCPGASTSSFGHSGFTGTFAWVDPEHEITYVFLCNRVYPTRQNRLLYELDIRTSILQSIYDSIIE